jgi:hypothetical protein
MYKNENKIDKTQIFLTIIFTSCSTPFENVPLEVKGLKHF